jgi:hypothetical protein
MKTLLSVLFVLFFSLACFGQEVEFCGSYNTSSDGVSSGTSLEQRLQNALGIGIQYQQDIIKRVKVGLGVHYNFRNTSFDHIPYIDDPYKIATEEIFSTAKRFSIRLNAQYLLKDNENVSLSIGPEITYNYLWGQDRIHEEVGNSSTVYNITRDNKLSGIFGAGLISKIEIKNFLTKQLALCFTIRNEQLIRKIETEIYGDYPAFSGHEDFVEFQVGLKYKFKK